MPRENPFPTGFGSDEIWWFRDENSDIHGPYKDQTTALRETLKYMTQLERRLQGELTPRGPFRRFWTWLMDTDSPI